MDTGFSSRSRLPSVRGNQTKNKGKKLGREARIRCRLGKCWEIWINGVHGWKSFQVYLAAINAFNVVSSINSFFFKVLSGWLRKADRCQSSCLLHPYTRHCAHKRETAWRSISIYTQIINSSSAPIARPFFSYAIGRKVWSGVTEIGASGLNVRNDGIKCLETNCYIIEIDRITPENGDGVLSV